MMRPNPASHRRRAPTPEEGLAGVLPRRSRGRRLSAAATGLLLVSTLTWHSTRASFTDMVRNSGNTWLTGTVALTDSRAGVAMFSAADTPLRPGTGSSRCLDVTYAGDIEAEVRLYISALDDHGGELDEALAMRVDMGSGSSCASPGSWTELSHSDLRSAARDASTWADGMAADSWVAAGNGESRPYRFTPVLADDDRAQGDQISVAFTWEARGR